MNLDVKAQIAERIAGAVCLLAVAGSAAFFAWDSHQTQVTTRQTVLGVTATLANVNRPCTPIKGQLLTVDNAKDCGLLAQSSITLNTLRGTLGQVEAAAKKNGAVSTDLHNTQIALQGTVNSLGKTSDALTRTANAATETLNAATDTLGEGERAIAAAQPLLAAYTASGYDLDALLKDQSIHRTINNVDRLSLALAGTTENMQGMTGDGKRVADDLTKLYFTPKPWWRKAGATMFDGTKVGVSLGCLLSRAC